MRLRFNLRIFLLAFSGVAIWLGWNVFVVEHRQHLIRDLGKKIHAQRLDVRYGVPADGDGMVGWIRDYHGLPLGAVYAKPTSPWQLSWIRRKLGDKPFLFVSFYDPELIPTVRRWFPEAVCMRRMVISNVHRQVIRNGRIKRDRTQWAAPVSRFELR